MKRSSKHPLFNSCGFGIGEIMVIFLVFSVMVTGILSLNGHLQKKAISGSEIAKIELLQNNIYGLVMDPAAWLRILAANGAPPIALPPFSAGSGATIDLYDSAGTAFYLPRTSATAGFRTDGRPCIGFDATTPTPNCPIRYDVRWYIATAATNPIVQVNAILQVSPGTISINPARFSYNYNNSPSNPLVRHLMPSWSFRGLTSSTGFEYLNVGLSSGFGSGGRGSFGGLLTLAGTTTAGLQACPLLAGFTFMGDVCATPGASCLYCMGGGTTSCASPGWELVTCE